MYITGQQIWSQKVLEKAKEGVLVKEGASESPIHNLRIIGQIISNLKSLINDKEMSILFSEKSYRLWSSSMMNHCVEFLD